MKPAPFDYVAPTTIEEAVERIAGGDATILAGGQTLVPLLALRMNNPSLVVDINRIPALKGVTRMDGATSIGAVTRQCDILSDAVIASHVPALAAATAHVGHHQTRNRGTIGGSICLGEPAAEYPATALALGVSIEARSKRGARKIAADEFYLGPYTNVLGPDELVTAIHFPDWPAGTLTVFREIARRPGDFALVGLVGALSIANGAVTRAGLAWFGMGPAPIKARQAEAAMIGQAANSLDLKSVAELALAETDPFDDHHATSEYRRAAAGRLFARALGEALNAREAA